MLSNLINLFYLNFIKALLKDGYCLKRATLIFHPIFSKCMKNLQLLKKAESQNLRKWYWSQETCFTLCTPLFTLPMAPRPIHSSFLYTSFPVARYVLIFKEISDIKYFGKRNFFLSKILLKGKSHRLRLKYDKRKIPRPCLYGSTEENIKSLPGGRGYPPSTRKSRCIESTL